MLEINIDSHEPIEYKIQALESGDIKFKIKDIQVLIERKNFDDLVRSHRNNRLAIQLNQMLQPDTLGILMIVGYPSNFSDISRKYIRNLLFSIFLMGIRVERVDNEADYKSRILEIIEYLKSEHFSLIPNRYSNPKLGALMWIPGIGYKKANQLLDTWQNSLVDIYTAPKQALARILGDTLADRFYYAVRKPVKQNKLEDDLKLWD